MRRAWIICQIGRPGCTRTREYVAIVKLPGGKEEVLEICEHCAELLLDEGKLLDIESLEE